MKKSNRKGFTIVELVIVIAVIAILAAVLIPTFASIVKKANDSSVQQALAAARKVIVAENAADADFDEASLTYVYKNGSKTEYYEWDGSKFVTADEIATAGSNDVVYAEEADADAYTAGAFHPVDLTADNPETADVNEATTYVSNEDLKNTVVVKDVA